MTTDVTRSIRDAIVRGEYAPNQRLVEADLSQQFTASRANVRTALTQLADEGLVERIPNRGVRVRAVSTDEAIEIYEVRELLEALCARKAAERISPESRRRLRSFAAAMRDAVRLNDVVGYGDLEQELHSHVQELGGQQAARRTLDRLRALSSRHQAALTMRPGYMASSLSGQLAIIDAICDGDADLAERAVRTHVSDALTRLRTPATQPVLAPAGRS